MAHQRLHRVQCNREDHDHGTGLFLDPPSHHGYVLNGNEPLWDLTKFIATTSGLSFLVFYKYACDGASSTSRNHDPFKSKRNEKAITGEIIPDAESVMIVSDNLRSVLLEVGSCSPFDGEYCNEMLAPYFFVYHRRSQLEKIAQDARQSKRAFEVACLLAYIENNHGREFDDADTLFAKGVVTPEHLPKLFIPNEMYGTYRHGYLDAFIISTWPQRQKYDRGQDKDLVVDRWSWKYDGHRLIRDSDERREWVSMRNQQEITIVDLHVIPLQYASKELRSRLISRGQKFWKSRFQRLVTYTGSDFMGDHTYDNTRFIIDTLTGERLHHTDLIVVPTPKDTMDPWPQDISNEVSQLRDEEMMLLPPEIFGFDLQAREWVCLCVEHVEDVKWDKVAFNHLVISSETKELIHAIVSAPKRRNGYSILFYGPPGTGKTLTAQFAAENANKPLFRISCDNFAMDIVEAERHLTDTFNLAQTWGCILLLDDADSLLEERSFKDHYRSRLASILIRLLELNEGIVFLACNRVKTFDAAVKSRIQVSLHYPSLIFTKRAQIWKNLVNTLGEEANVAELKRHVGGLAILTMNGHEISNCVKTAQELAAFKGQKLGWQHLRHVVVATRGKIEAAAELSDDSTDDEMAI